MLVNWNDRAGYVAQLVSSSGPEGISDHPLLFSLCWKNTSLWFNSLNSSEGSVRLILSADKRKKQVGPFPDNFHSHWWKMPSDEAGGFFDEGHNHC